MEWRSVSIYFNKNGEIFIIPCRGCPEGMVESEPWYITHISDEETVYNYIKTAYEITAEGIEKKPNPSPIEIITKIKNWERATRELGLLDFQWREDIDGFVLNLQKRKGGGFAGYKTIKIGDNIIDSIFKPVIIENLKNEYAIHVKLMEKKQRRNK